MQIGGIQAAGGTGGVQPGVAKTDAVTRNIQRQITEIQKKMQELSENKELSLDEKMKKRQEYNSQIQELNMQLRQHEIEMRQEKQQQKEPAMNEMLGTGEDSSQGNDGTKTGFTEAGAKALVSAQSAKKLSKVQGHVATELKAKIRTLASEIKEDASRGIHSTEKMDALADLEEKKGNAEKKQTGLLAGAADEMAEAAEKDRAEGTKETADRKKDENENDLYDQENGVDGNEGNSTIVQTIDIRL